MLTFVRAIGMNSRKQRISEYLCSCGKIFSGLDYNIKSGHTKSCGCMKRRLVSAASLTHGEARPKTPEYAAWAGMKSRCLNEKCSSFSRYGGRGIKIHPMWVESYDAFLSYMGRKPSVKHSIDRIDNNGHYEPGNVRWALPVTQARNRRTSRMIEFQGKTQCLEDWASDLGICQSTLFERLQKWPFDKALTKHKDQR